MCAVLHPAQINTLSSGCVTYKQQSRDFVSLWNQYSGLKWNDGRLTDSVSKSERNISVSGKLDSLTVDYLNDNWLASNVHYVWYECVQTVFHVVQMG